MNLAMLSGAPTQDSGTFTPAPPVPLADGARPDGGTPVSMPTPGTGLGTNQPPQGGSTLEAAATSGHVPTAGDYGSDQFGGQAGQAQNLRYALAFAPIDAPEPSVDRTPYNRQAFNISAGLVDTWQGSEYSPLQQGTHGEIAQGAATPPGFMAPWREGQNTWRLEPSTYDAALPLIGTAPTVS